MSPGLTPRTVAAGRTSTANVAEAPGVDVPQEDKIGRNPRLRTDTARTGDHGLPVPMRAGGPDHLEDRRHIARHAKDAPAPVVPRPSRGAQTEHGAQDRPGGGCWPRRAMRAPTSKNRASVGQGQDTDASRCQSVEPRSACALRTDLGAFLPFFFKRLALHGFGISAGGRAPTKTPPPMTGGGDLVTLGPGFAYSRLSGVSTSPRSSSSDAPKSSIGAARAAAETASA